MTSKIEKKNMVHIPIKNWNGKHSSIFLSFTLVIIMLICLGSCTAPTPKNIEITGKVKGFDKGVVYLRKFYNKMFFTIDSCKLDSGRFHFAENLQVPELYGLTTDTAIYPVFVFLNKGDKITVDLDTSGYEKSLITGSPENDLFRKYRNTQGEVKIDSFIKQNPKSIVSAYILYREYSYRLTPEELQYNISLLDTSLSHTQYLKVVNDLVEVVKRVSPGNSAIDFALPDTSGKPLKLADSFGQVLLLDFWASWCPPCRQENPHLVKLYHTYKEKGFTIFSVSLDKNRAAWVAAIKNDGLNWKHVSDLQFWNSAAAKLYGVRAIPSNVLIDRSGTIIARNLIGESLDAKLEEIFQNKRKK